MPDREPTDGEVERVARAIWAEQNAIMHDHDALWRQCGTKPIWLDCARAAIAAMPPVKTGEGEKS